MALLSVLGRDFGPLFLLVLTAIIWRRNFYMRGLTYRASVVPAGREKIMKSIFYIGLLGSFDAALRRMGQLLVLLKLPVFPKSERSAFLLRLLLLHVPWAVWAIRGPLSERGSTRDDRGWSDGVTRSRFWRLVSAVFGHAQIVLSEEWRQLSTEQIRHWMDRHYVCGSFKDCRITCGALVGSSVPSKSNLNIRQIMASSGSQMRSLECTRTGCCRLGPSWPASPGCPC